ncbi:MAG: PEP-CTERM sorting domain-containing protein [Kiritimatiellia bacterium]
MLRNKAIILGFLLFLATSLASLGDPQIWWGSNYAFTGSGDPDIFDRSGVAVPTSADWAIQLCRTSDDAVLYTAPGTAWSAAGPAGTFFDTGSDGTTLGINGVPIYTRIWDSNTPDTGWYADTGATTLSWSTTPAPPGSVNYNVGTVASGDWKVIPEPGTVGLFGIGLLVIAGRRKLRSKKQPVAQ